MRCASPPESVVEDWPRCRYPSPTSHQRFELDFDLRDILEHAQRFFDRGLQQIGDRMALIFHLQRFVIIAPAAAHVAGDIDVRKEIHFDALQAVALAGFAAPALHVEAEAARACSRARAIPAASRKDRGWA